MWIFMVPNQNSYLFLTDDHNTAVLYKMMCLVFTFYRTVLPGTDGQCTKCHSEVYKIKRHSSVSDDTDKLINLSARLIVILMHLILAY